MKRNSGFLTLIMILGLTGFGQQTTFANCYPSGVKITGTTATTITVRYVLNEDADGSGGSPGVTINVRKASDNSIVRTVTFSGTVTETRRGVHTYVWDKKDNANNPVPASNYYFEIITLDDGYAAWTRFVGPAPSQFPDTTLNNFELPRGVAVNRNNAPGNEYFGRIYVSNPRTASTGAGRTMGNGLYLLNADFSDTDIAGGSGPKTGGVDWTLDDATSASGPFKLFIPDGSNDVYITDWSDQHSGLWVADPEMGAATEVLDSSGGRLGTGLVTGVHGSVAGVYVEGAGVNRKIYTVDEDLPAAADPLIGSIWRYDIGTAPTTAGPPVTYYDDATNNYIQNTEMDLARCNDGTFYISQVRAVTGALTNLMHVSADGTTVLWRSVPDSGAATSDVDKFYQTRGIGYDPLNNLIAASTGQTTTGNVGKITVMNATSHAIVAELNFTGTSNATNTDCCFDAVGNLYVGNRSGERVRVWSPPTGVNTYTTRSASVSTAAPTINTPPQNQTVCAGANNVQFTVSATGTGTLSYLWYKGATPLSDGALPDGTTVSGSTTSTLTLSNVQPAESGATFKVDVTDINGTSTSSAATLTIAAITITQHPYHTTVQAAQNASFTVTALTDAPSGSLTYQWFKSPSTPVGTNSATLTLTAVTAADAASYFVRITDACSQIDSAAAKLTVLNPPCSNPFADADGNGIVDMNDFGAFQRCYTGASGNGFDAVACGCFDRDADNNVDPDDLTAFLACAGAAGGHRVTADPSCDGEAAAFSDNFDADHTTNWTVNVTPSSNSFAEFFFDYGAIGIPSAPHSGGTTRGLRLRANTTGSVGGGVSVSPTGMHFTGNYTVRFDAWINYNPPVFQGGSGSTMFTTWGVMTSGAVPNTSTNVDGIFLAVDGDAGTNFDYRLYDPANTGSHPDGDAVYAANQNTPTATTRNAGHPYYTQFFGGTVENVEAPAAEIAHFPTAGWGGVGDITDAGAQGYKWRDVTIIKNGKWAVFYIDGHLIATVDSTAAGTLGGDNIMVGQTDFDTGSSSDPNAPEMIFGLIDNLTVTPN